MARLKKKLDEYQWSGDVTRVIPLAQGTRCRIMDENGKSHSFDRGSVAFEAEVARLDAIMDGKVTRELTDLGWV